MKKSMPADMKEVYELRAETTDYFFPDREDEIEFWYELAKEYGEKVLHVMCGTGEITAGLAQKGLDMTGLDLTNSMIYQAENRLEEKGLNDVDIKEGDARYFNLGKQFDFIFISNSDFHHFTEREEIDSFLAKAYAHLKKSGGLALELLDIPEEFKNKERKLLPERAPPRDMTLWKIHNSSFHPENNILEIKEEINIERDDDIKKSEYDIQLKLFSKDMMENILEDSGFYDIEFKEGTDVTPYLEDTKTRVVEAKR